MNLDDMIATTWLADDKEEEAKCLKELQEQHLQNIDKWKMPSVFILLPQPTDDEGNPTDNRRAGVVIPDLAAARNFINMMIKEDVVEDKILGCFFGQAIGDALGLGTEFMRRGEVFYNYPEKLTEYNQIIQDDHRCRWYKGQWTDDTDMMLCIARAIIDCDGHVDLMEIAKNFKEWYNGNPLGIGHHTANVLGYTEYEKNPIRSAREIWEAYGKRSAANGGLMRTSIVGLLKNYTPTMAEDICRLTHPHPQCVGSCVVVSTLIHKLVYTYNEPTCEELIEIADRYDEKIAEYIRLAHDGQLCDVPLDSNSMGYTLYTLFAALWSYFHAETFLQGLIPVVNAGGDADTNAAVACAILGAKFGFREIPEKYVEELYQTDRYRQIAKTFWQKQKALK